ncbi:MAG: dTMP kinase [Candidatus Cloacimonetes bacterium]|nr:dTMP kinase [Candidatus Cloacimonadota bacterium]
MKGKFITFEGIEGCGKSTQAKLLGKYFAAQGYDILQTREPGGPKISEAIRDVLLSIDNMEMLPETEMLLYMASRSQHTGEWIIPALKEGKIVISDRFYDSTIAYQGAARNIDSNIIDTIREYATYGLVPEITILIDLPVEIGFSRISTREIDRLEQESISFHKKVRDGFLALAKKHSDRFIVINGDQSVDAIHAEIVEKISKLMRLGR